MNTSPYPKSAKLAIRADARLNKRAGRDWNTVTGHFDSLMAFGQVRVEWVEGCGKTHFLAHVVREWRKVVANLRAEGAVVSEERLKFKNSWATSQGGYYEGCVYTLETHPLIAVTRVGSVWRRDDDPGSPLVKVTRINPGGTWLDTVSSTGSTGVSHRDALAKLYSPTTEPFVIEEKE